MSKPVHDPEFWRQRVEKMRYTRPSEVHRTVLELTAPVIHAVEEAHRKLLKRVVRDADSVLDVGCGYGRLLDCMPPTWKGEYLGVDLSPDLLELAVARYPKRKFMLCRAQDLRPRDGRWNIAVVCSFKGMILDNQGPKAWDAMRTAVMEIAEALVVLETGEPSRMELEIA